MQRADVPTRMLQCFHRPNCCLRIAIDALHGRRRVAGGVLGGGVACPALFGRERKLLAQLAPLAVQCAALDFQPPRGLGTALQRLLELAHREPLRREPATDVVLFASPRA